MGCAAIAGHSVEMRFFAHLGLCPAHLVAAREDAAQTLFVPEIVGQDKKCSGHNRQWQRWPHTTKLAARTNTANASSTDSLMIHHIQNEIPGPSHGKVND
jgi:hypothetical protein